MCQGGKQSPPCANAGPLVQVFNKGQHYHYLPMQAHRLGHLFLCWGKHKRPLSRAVIYERVIRRTWSYLYLTGVAVDLYFLLGLALCCLGFFPPPSSRVEAGEMWWLGSAPEERQSLGSSCPYSALLGRNLSGISEYQLWWTRVGHSHSAAFWWLERGCCHGHYVLT